MGSLIASHQSIVFVGKAVLKRDDVSMIVPDLWGVGMG